MHGYKIMCTKHIVAKFHVNKWKKKEGGQPEYDSSHFKLLVTSSPIVRWMHGAPILVCGLLNPNLGGGG